MSLVETVTNVIGMYVLAVATQILVFLAFCIDIGLAHKMAIGIVFVGISLARGSVLRRVFTRIHVPAD